MRNFFLIVFLLISTLAYAQVVETQDVPSVIDKAYTLIDNEKYEDGLKLLQNIDESQTIVHGDSCTMMFNYEMGSCLFFLDKYEEAIPYLNKALLKMEKLSHEDCIYLELIYGIGSCYNKLKQYHNAEKYFRRVIIRGNVLKFKCKITTQTLSELTEVYNKLGYTKLAEECAIKINSEVEDFPSESWSNRVEGLFDLAESYEKQRKFDEEIEAYHQILDLIESNVGKNSDDYLLYSGVLLYRLKSQNRQEETIELLKEMIGIGQSYRIHKDIVCRAYEDYLEIMAKQNETGSVEDMLPNAVEYIQHTTGYDWQNYNLYERIGNAFAESENYSYGVKYLEMPWNGKYPNNIRSLGNLGIGYYFKQDYQKSISYLKKAEGMINDSTNNVTRKVIYSYLNTAYSHLNNLSEAVEYAERVAPLIKEIDGDDLYASHLISWAVDLIKANQTDRALELFKEVNLLLPIISDKTKIYYYSQYGFASIGLTNYHEAIESLKSGIALSIRIDGVDNIWLTTMYHNLGRAYMLQQDNANALLFLNKSKDLQMKLNGNAMQRTLDYINECESK